VYIGSLLLMFHDKLPVPSSNIKLPKALKDATYGLTRNTGN